ncbi:hypothetical protein ACSSS7_006644 [Eimeria intestinalis]
MAIFIRHLQPAKASVAALALLGLALSPGSTLQLHSGHPSPSMQQTLMMYPSVDGPLVFAEETPEGLDDEKSPLLPQGEGDDMQQSEGPTTPENEGDLGQQQEGPVASPGAGKAPQQEAPKRSRAARLGARVRRAAGYIPKQLRKFYAKVKGGARRLWERVRARFGRRRGQQPERPEGAEEPEDFDIKEYFRNFEKRERKRLRPRWRSASFKMPGREFPAEARRRAASVGGGSPHDLSSPWVRPPRERAASFGGSPHPEAPIGRRRRAASLGGGPPVDLSSPWAARGEGEEGKGGTEEGELPRPPSEASTDVSEGDQGEGIGGQPEEGAMGGAPAAAPRKKPEFPLRISPLDTPLTDARVTGEMEKLKAKATTFELVFAALFLTGDIRTARRLSAVLSAHQLTRYHSLKSILKLPPGVIVDAALAASLEGLYSDYTATNQALTMLTREKLEFYFSPDQMDLVDNLMKELAAAIRQLGEGDTFQQALELFSQMNVDFPDLARKLKDVLPSLRDILERAKTLTEAEGEALKRMITTTNTLIEYHSTSTPFSNRYVFQVLNPALKFVGGRAACDLINVLRLAENFGALAGVLKESSRRWTQEEWIHKILEAVWGHRPATAVVDRPTARACNEYKSGSPTPREDFPWFALLPHFNRRDVVVD